MCGGLYLPMFLLRMGLFSLINMDLLNVLAKVCPSLPTMLKLSSVVGWPEVDYRPYIDEGVFIASFNLSPVHQTDVPMYSS